jgi:hypothetical protein
MGVKKKPFFVPFKIHGIPLFYGVQFTPLESRRLSNGVYSGLIMGYPAFFHASTPPARHFTLSNPIDMYFAA